MSERRRVVLVQLPIPQPGPEPAHGNVPLAAGSLVLHARNHGLGTAYDLEIFPPALANRLADRGLVEAILAREPWLVGFTCYLWNVERTLWVAEQLRARRPDLLVLVGGPEITPDNSWVLQHPQVDLAAIGEGEQTFVDLLDSLRERALPAAAVPGLFVSPQAEARTGSRSDRAGLLPPARAPLPSLDPISSPYLHGLLDAGEERLLLLETIRGCIFKCKFCYYPKSYDALYVLSADKIAANLRHAREHGVGEVVLLDPTLNQRPDFAAFLRLLADCNPDHAFTYSGELRAEGIDAEIARALRRAHFTEVEIGLQSIDSETQRLMDRRNNMRAFERGVRSLLDAGIRVRIDLIVGLPGDTPESVRRGMRWIRETGLYTDVQVFNLAVLPGTDFRTEAPRHGLVYQERPPYYVLRTPDLDLEDICGLVGEAEDLFTTEFDALPPPRLDLGPLRGDPPGIVRSHRVDLDRSEETWEAPPIAARRALGFTLWLRGDDLGARGDACVRLVRQILDDNPHTTLQVVLEPKGDPRCVTPELLERLLGACYRVPTYLDKFYAVAPGPVKGTKRLVVLVPTERRHRLGGAWIGAVGECATIVWRGAPIPEADLDAHEYAVASLAPSPAAD